MTEIEFNSKTTFNIFMFSKKGYAQIKNWEYVGKSGLVSHINVNKFIYCHKINYIWKLGCSDNGILHEALPSHM